MWISGLLALLLGSFCLLGAHAEPINHSEPLRRPPLPLLPLGPGLEFAYALIGEGAKSQARQAEALTIQALRNASFPLASDADSKNKSFGRKRGPQEEGDEGDGATGA